MSASTSAFRQLSVAILKGFLRDRAAVFFAVAWRIGHLGADAWASEEVTGILGVPLGHVYAFICAMSVVTAGSFLATLPAAFCRGAFIHPSMPLDEVSE